MSRRRNLIILAVIASALMCLRPADGAINPRAQQSFGIPNRAHPFWWAQIDFTKPHNVPWDDSDFATLAKSGMNGVEINMNWGDIEPQKDHYDFQLLDRYLAEAAKAHLKLYFLFWESVWAEGQGKNPPTWLTARELSSDGIPALEPPWWDMASRKAYFDYIARTIDHAKVSPGFGGVYSAYGWLDSEWGPSPKGSSGITGYAPVDIQEYYRWLPRTYKTLADFNRRWHTSYTSWNRIPVPRPGDSLFPVYQRFRLYSVVDGFDAVTHLIRMHTNATILFSWGGDICGRIGPAVQGNDPDTFFQIAKKYHAIVNLDDSNLPGLALLFGSMARSYGVPLLQEWTPHHSGLDEEIPGWLGHIGLAAPVEVGEDFFIYPPPQRPGFADAWNAYQKWHPTLVKVIQGEAPEQPVAVIVPMRQIVLSTDLNTYPTLTTDLGNFWLHYHVLPHFITDQQVAQGTVSLQQFRAVVDLGNEVTTLPALKTYAQKRPVLKTLDQAVPYLHPYMAANPESDLLEVVPTVEGSTVWLTVANCDGAKAYTGTIRFDPAAIGLRSAASFSIKDATTGQTLAASRTADGKIQWQADLPPASFHVLQLRLN